MQNCIPVGEGIDIICYNLLLLFTTFAFTRTFVQIHNKLIRIKQKYLAVLVGKWHKQHNGLQLEPTEGQSGLIHETASEIQNYSLIEQASKDSSRVSAVALKFSVPISLLAYIIRFEKTIITNAVF